MFLNYKKLLFFVFVFVSINTKSIAQELIANGGFESPILSSNFVVNPTNFSPWSFFTIAGIQKTPASSGYFVTGGSMEGSQYAFLQANTSRIQQEVFLAAGSYNLKFLYAGRNTGGDPSYGGNTTLTAAVNGTSVFSTNTTSASNVAQASIVFNVASPGMNTIGFTVSAVGDQTALLDNISLAAIPEPNSLLLIFSIIPLLIIPKRRKSLI